METNFGMFTLFAVKGKNNLPFIGAYVSSKNCKSRKSTNTKSPFYVGSNNILPSNR